MTYGFVPVMKVEREIVTLAQFLKVYSAISHFDGLSQKNPSSDADLKRRAFTNIIESKFLDTIVKKTNANLGADELVEKLVSESKALSLGEASERLYGLSATEFKQLVLLPEARKELLERHYEYNPDELEKLWTDLYQTAEVKIYYPGFYWENGDIKTK